MAEHAMAELKNEIVELKEETKLTSGIIEEARIFAEVEGISAPSLLTKIEVTVKDKNKLKTNVTNINSYMTKIDTELKSLSNNINAMMVGDKTTPYWNGSDAATFYKNAIANLKHDIDAYVSARNQLDALGELYELVNSGYKK